jgi:hypothetical protein
MDSKESDGYNSSSKLAKPDSYFKFPELKGEISGHLKNNY